MPGFTITKKILLVSALSLLITGCGKQIKNSDALLKKSVDLVFESGKWKQSLGYANRAVKLDANSVDAQIMLAICMDKTGDSDEGAKVLRNLLLTTKNNFLAEFTLGKILYDSKKYEEAYEHLANAYNLNNDSAEALVLYAECAGNVLAENTPELYGKLLNAEQFSGKPEVYNNLGVYYANRQNHNAAFSNFMKAYRLTPSNPIVVANLGILKDSYSADHKQAKFFYRKFISITGGNAAFKEQRQYFSDRLKKLKQN